ncbi:MAG TPA: hypothetical protein VMM84_05690 [Pyrinomonadaceae bacterium]|nr:hypothetical protein [Pyrinomonadaceae bacterium]
MIKFLALFLFSTPLHMGDLYSVKTLFQVNTKSAARLTQSPTWNPATFRGLTMGKSTRLDMIGVFGEPKWSELFYEDKANSECWHHYESGGEFPGELVFNVDKSTGVILRIILHPKNLTLKDAIKRLGENYVITRYDFCQGFEEHDSAPLY